MNSTEREFDPKSIDNESVVEQADRNDDSKPVCKNGVCELNWQPKRPQAA